MSHNQGTTTDGGAVIHTAIGEDPADFISSDASGAMTLADFEAMALASNPTIQQLTATTQKAAGFRQQVGLRANPVIGYDGTQIADEGTDQHTAFIEQEFVTGGKLELNRRVLNEAVRAQWLELEAQQQRVRTDIRINFYRALAAQQRVALTTEFQSVGRKGFELAGVRKRAMEASQIEVLQAKIQMNQVDLAKQQAEVAYAAAWRELAAMAGNPNMQPVALVGEFNDQLQPIDWTATRSTLLAGSPEYLAAQTRVQQACLYLERQGIQAIPNLTVQLASGVDNGTNSGLINLQVGAPIPVFNKNQGNIAAARAEYCRALMEVTRIENSIQARLAAVSNDYDSALAAVNKYQIEILPSVRETLGLAEEAYRAGEFSFLEVLIVRRTYFESSLEYLNAQVQLAQASAKVDGYVLTGGLDA
ncbi:MAG: TolC family protein, partial [Planctomycetaceae bacterium]